MKKIKNPERYINRLKAENQRLSNQVEFRNREINQLRDDNRTLRMTAFGDEWFSWSSPSRLSVNFTQKDTVNRARIGAKVIAVGEVIEFKESKTGENTAHMDFKTVYIKD